MPAGLLSGRALEVAPLLLGVVVVGRGVRVRLTEVEAYEGTEDPGSHARRGPTPRNASMFADAGTAYVYRAYGLHTCLNVTCGPVGTPGAVLLRAGEVLDGHEDAYARRLAARRGPLPPAGLARGPGNLTTCLGVERDDDGADLCSSGSALALRRSGARAPRESVARGPRVGVSGPGGDALAFPWRFWLAGDPTVSAYRAGGRRRGRPIETG